ncbi:ribosomal L28e protein family domain-containing protein [Trichoderma afarasin]|uniref:Ribosomal_L28e domain-containing protein n=1 Tax=Trichoderma simmonsii TaxID=1491479 RepID=A0A8G0LKV1_9HYPO|nr:Ribosomal_L28e domain-containing protein [Trichoderma simmonsii]
MAAATLPNISSDLIWEVVRSNNSYLHKTGAASNGGVQFSRDPLNLKNVHSRKYAGFVNEKAVGIAPGEKGGVVVTSKKTAAAHQPSKSAAQTSIGGGKSTRKTYKAVAAQVAKTGYRADLRAAAIERASAIRRSQLPVKADPEPKLRGKKAKAAAAGES